MERRGLSKVLIVYSHPSRTSLNGAILDNVVAGLTEAGLESRVKDLCREKFDPVLDEKEWKEGFEGIVPEACQEEQRQIAWADSLIFILPAWNFSIPAVLKGYLDRVFVIPGFSVAMDETGTEYRGGMLGHKRALVIQTLGGELRTAFRYGNVSNYAAPLVSSLHYTGIKDVETLQVWNVYKKMDEAEYARILTEVRRHAAAFDSPRRTRLQLLSTEG